MDEGPLRCVRELHNPCVVAELAHHFMFVLVGL